MGSWWRAGYTPTSLVLQRPAAAAFLFAATQVAAMVLEPLAGVQWHTPLTVAYGLAAGGYCCFSPAFHADLAHLQG
eukprot:CAMPEP_0204570866 /NCGR_PEP_ID=MMETSP0661-20131031/38564_1 /ASSEMBLY_ACC=CAM_ASM_000606 /TAXON_ID=109239 /ORGANISM="Alexandrium margalefi, Strain AMGDE01CS-322" /LENGTH=75 /DNA_ID=CAMNT_0051579083 /DNA_START=42 /DNA_END=265 /DNA_ORIENTATION=-